MRTCDIPNCEERHQARGWCNNHYKHWLRHGDPMAVVSTLIHGQRKTRTYRIWTGMKSRCSNPNEMNFPRYGGRGIKVCERWLKFANFFADMGEAPEGLTLERKDNNGHYEPSNCKWATPTEQANNRRSNRRYIYNGTPYTVAELSRISGIKACALNSRLSRLWDINRAMTEPVGSYQSRRNHG